MLQPVEQMSMASRPRLQGSKNRPKRGGYFFQGLWFSQDPFTGLNFSQKDFERALLPDGGVVRTHNGGWIDYATAERQLREKVNLPLGLQAPMSAEEWEAGQALRAYEANGKVGTGFTRGFNKGQKDGQVLRGKDQKVQQYDSQFDHGRKITDSYRARKLVNGMNSSLNDSLQRIGVPGFLAGVGADTVTAVPNFFAELQTIGDPMEDSDTRLRATANALFAAGTSAVGGTLAKTAFAPAVKRVAKFAAPLTEKTKGAYQRLGKALYDNAKEAERIATQELKMPLAEVKKMIADFRKSLPGSQSGKKAVASERQSKGSGRLTSKVNKESTMDSIGDHPRAAVKSPGMGKKAILAAIDEEARRGTTFSSPYALQVTKKWIDLLPEGQLDYLLNFEDDIGKNVRGEYKPSATEGYESLLPKDPTMAIARRYRKSNLPAGIVRTYIHEHFHHLQNFLTNKDIDDLMGQYLRENPGELKKGTLEELRASQKFNERFSEWWADKAMDYFYKRDIKEFILEEQGKGRYYKAMVKAVAAIQNSAQQTAAFLRRRGAPDYAQAIFEDLIPRVKTGKPGARNYNPRGAGGGQLRDSLSIEVKS